MTSAICDNDVIELSYKTMSHRTNEKLRLSPTVSHQMMYITQSQGPPVWLVISLDPGRRD